MQQVGIPIYKSGHEVTLVTLGTFPHLARNFASVNRQFIPVLKIHKDVRVVTLPPRLKSKMFVYLGNALLNMREIIESIF
jgi:hypothetical protein